MIAEMIRLQGCWEVIHHPRTETPMTKSQNEACSCGCGCQHGCDCAPPCNCPGSED